LHWFCKSVFHRLAYKSLFKKCQKDYPSCIHI
jgi:hypothetical protein